MNTVASSLGRSAVVALSVTTALTLLAGVVGGMWRVAFAGSAGTARHLDAAMLQGTGFEMGFGVPFGGVVVLAALVAVPTAVGFFLYDYLTCGPCPR
jgi:hypothetical protein